VVSAPLSLVWRQGDGFIVALRSSTDANVFRVTLIKQIGQWVVTQVVLGNRMTAVAGRRTLAGFALTARSPAPPMSPS